ncbi:hypothetical protein MUK42_36967 [Musa troglodytarum]|uniref:Uncharacterized protein n=1 Tax=Musa troglodytarum TaxID=320322 RepID=A0A9E7JDH6_9LILI|nr:hypothetical protein MUK42_36967 [Musa troglodytarum]
MATEDSVRRVVREELQRTIPEFAKQICEYLSAQYGEQIREVFRRLSESKMQEEPEHVIPQTLNQTDNIMMHQQANGVTAHTSQLPR